MKEYQGFAISNARTGFDQAVEPWLLPRDGYQQIVNAHLYRGVIEKIEGYQLFASFTNRNILSLGTPDGVTTTFTGTLPSIPVNSNITAYGTIVVGVSAETFGYSSDASTSVINETGSAGGTGTVNIINGNYSITFNTAPPLDPASTIFISWDSAVSVVSAIMGIKQYYASNGSQQVLVFDTRRVGKIISNMGVLSRISGALQSISEIPHDYYASAIITGNGSTTTFTGTLAGAPFVPGTLVWIVYLANGTPQGTVITDNGFGALSGTGATGTINYTTGVYSITFSPALANTYYIDSTTGIYGDLFTGDFTNFFSLTNYMYYAFFCNNVDPIFYYDGKSIHYLNTSLTFPRVIYATSGRPQFNTANGYDISKCLHVFTYRQTLLLISPTVLGVLKQSTIYWSTVLQPLVFSNDDELTASTSEAIRAIGYINTDLVVRFSNSERIFRWTGDDTNPYRFDTTNNIWACDSPYSTINYDTWFSTVGRPAIVGSDAVNVKRVDEIIPDFTDPTRLSQQTPAPFLNQTSIGQCYGERFDDIKEGWMCYNSAPYAQTSVTPSDNVLAFNYLDSTYAVYAFPFSCLGYGRIINVPTWSTITSTWEETADTWDSYELQSNALVDLAGDQYDRVYELQSGNTQTAPGDPTTTPIPVLMSVTTKNFNPFIEDGQLCRFGYLDLLVSTNQNTILRVQFYLNDQLYIDYDGNPAGYYQETILKFTPTDAMSPNTNQVKVWKRIYVGSVGKEHTIRLYQNPSDFTDLNLNQPVFIHSLVPYFKPAGRIFN